ncbi:MAG: type II secretion system protein [Ilumatobacter sp.]|nr:type II secretion system protein [Ilumatobacter sp.]
MDVSPLLHRAHLRGADDGNTYVEVLVSIVLLGIVVVALMGAMQASIAFSAISNDQAKTESVLNSAADRVANFAYKPCPGNDGAGYLAIAQAAAPAVGWTGDVVTIDDVEFYQPTTDSWAPSNSLDPSECNSSIGLSDSRTLQKVQIRVTAPSGKTSSTEVIKANFRPDEIKDLTEG